MALVVYLYYSYAQITSDIPLTMEPPKKKRKKISEENELTIPDRMYACDQCDYQVKYFDIRFYY